jgi:hypothetical protein
MEKTATKYSDMEKFKSDVLYTFSDMMNTRMAAFEEQLTKFETID